MQTLFGHFPCLRPFLKQPTWDFHYPCKILLQLLNHLGIPFPCVQKNSQIKRHTASWSQQQFYFWSTKVFPLFLRRMIQIEDLRRILNWFESVWLKVCFWENKTMRFWKTLRIFIDKSHIYRPLVAFQKLMKGCDF